MNRCARYGSLPAWLPATLVLWGLAGPVLAADESAEELARFDARIKPTDRQHWSFQPVRKPVLPAVKDHGWVRSPIDAFVLARLEEKGWKPAAAAEPSALLRRVYLDLIGLPPTPTEQSAFLRNPS